MLESIPWGQVGIGSGWALVAVFVVYIYRGKLHTDPEWERMVKDHQREIEDVAHDRNEWRTAHRISEQARLEERENTRDLITSFGSTLTGFLDGFRKAAQEAQRHQDGGPTP